MVDDGFCLAPFHHSLLASLPSAVTKFDLEISPSSTVPLGVLVISIYLFLKVILQEPLNTIPNHSWTIHLINALSSSSEYQLGKGWAVGVIGNLTLPKEYLWFIIYIDQTRFNIRKSLSQSLVVSLGCESARQTFFYCLFIF